MFKIKIVTFNKDLEKSIRDEFKSEEPDLIVPIGGDGTFIHAIKSNIDLIKNGIPVYGIANGTLNFLMNKYEYDHINKLLEHIQRKENIEFIETPILSYYINNEFKGYAINEVVFGESIREYPKFQLAYDEFSTRLNGSMFSISSPIGSTGLSKNIGGAIIPNLKYDLININTIACDKEIHKTIENTKIFITSFYYRNKIPVLIDNKIVDYMSNNDTLMVELGIKVKIGYNDIESFEKKRILSMINH